MSSLVAKSCGVEIRAVRDSDDGAIAITIGGLCL